jgi:type IV pilus assembly protein PilW
MMTAMHFSRTHGLLTTKMRRQSGVSLIELLVGLAIGLILALVASATYLYSKQSFNSSTETSQLEENGRYALNMLTRYIQSAGFVMVDPTNPSPQGPIDNKIFGCDFGLKNPTAATTATLADDLSCLTATPTGARRSASIALFSETDAYSGSSGKFQGYDCVGNGSVAIPVAGSATIHETRSYFFVGNTTVQTANGSVNMGQLSCLADRTVGATPAFQAEPLLPGIEQLAFSYLLPSVADPETAQMATTAAAVTAASQWPSVLGVEVCVLAKSVQPGGNDTGTTYTDCYGSAITAAPGEVYRTFTTTVRLRNKSSI